MTMIIEGKMFAGYQNPDTTDKDTGEIKKGKFVVQFMEEKTLKNNEKKNELVSISVPNELAPKYKGKEGQNVQIKCNYLVDGKKVIFYGVL